MVLLVSFIHLVLQTNVPLTCLFSSAKWSLPSCTPGSAFASYPACPFILSLLVFSMLRIVHCFCRWARCQSHSSACAPCEGCAPVHIAHSPLTWLLTISKFTAGKAHTCLHPNDNTLVERFLVLVSSYMPKCLKQEKERCEERIFTK